MFSECISLQNENVVYKMLLDVSKLENDSKYVERNMFYYFVNVTPAKKIPTTRKPRNDQKEKKVTKRQEAGPVQPRSESGVPCEQDEVDKGVRERLPALRQHVLHLSGTPPAHPAHAQPFFTRVCGAERLCVRLRTGK